MQSLYFISLFFAGVLAGMEIAIHYGLGTAPAVLSDQSQILLRQALVRKLRILLPAFFVPTLGLGISVAVLDRAAPSFRFQCAGLFALVTWIVIRTIGTVPINSATLAWDAEAPPQNWKALVNRAESFHIIGVWAAAIAFVLLLTAVAVRLQELA